MNTPSSTSGRGYRITIAIGRVLFGLVFIMAGTTNLLMTLHVMQEPAQKMPEAALAFATALKATGYMMPMIAITQLLVGLLLVCNRFVPLALALIAPFMVNSVCFHLFLEPSGRPPSMIIFIVMLVLAWAYRGSFTPMLNPRAKPSTTWTPSSGTSR